MSEKIKQSIQIDLINLNNLSKQEFREQIQQDMRQNSSLQKIQEVQQDFDQRFSLVESQLKAQIQTEVRMQAGDVSVFMQQQNDLMDSVQAKVNLLQSENQYLRSKMEQIEAEGCSHNQVQVQTKLLQIDEFGEQLFVLQK